MRRVLIVLASLIILGGTTLFGTSVWLAERSESRHPAIGQFVEVDGLQIHYRDTGQQHDSAGSTTCHTSNSTPSPTLVLLHGASTSLLDYETSLRPALENEFRVVAFDRPGHGYSERGDSWPTPTRQAAIIRAALQQLGIEKSLWIGHSWSGSVILSGLLDEAEHVEAGVLIAGATHPWEGGSAWHATMAARPIIGPVFSALFIELGGRLSLEEAIQSVFTPETMPEDYIEDTGVTLSIRPKVYQNNADDLTRLSAFLGPQSMRYPEILQPVLSLTGSSDEVVPAWNHDARLQEQLTSIESVSMEGSGHAFHHTRTEAVAQAIRQFINGSLIQPRALANAQNTRDAPSAETCPEAVNG